MTTLATVRNSSAAATTSASGAPRNPPPPPAERKSAPRRSDLFGPGGGKNTGQKVLELAGRLLRHEPLLGRSLGWDSVRISSNDDDPFAKRSNVERLPRTDFTLDEAGRPVGLEGPWVKILDEDVIYRADPQTGRFVPFANNPWPRQVRPDHLGNFVFPNEPRFPKHEVVRGPDGRPLPGPGGLQQWVPRDLHQGMTTAFEAANTTRRTQELWAGRSLPFGNGGQLEINTHAFIDFNAFYSPSGKALFFGVLPYRMPGEKDIKMFEMASSWEVVAHETGHALHHVLKPNADNTDHGFRTWGESFADQTAMWASTQDPERVRALLKETDGIMRKSSSLTRVGEVFAALTGEGTAMRDAFQNKTVSQTSPEFHERSEVLTGAAYKIFEQIYADLTQNQGLTAFQAIQRAGEVMGTLNARAADFTPENRMTLEDVGKAYLKADQELFGGKYRDLIVPELQRRQIFSATSAADFDAREAALPQLSVPGRTPEAADAVIQANLDALGIGPQFGLRLQDHQVDASGRQIVRVQLTEGRGDEARPLANHGVLVLREDGTLADWHGPLPGSISPSDAVQLLEKAREVGLDQHGAAPRLVERPGGGGSVEALAIRGEGIDAYAEVFSLENPGGERRELVERKPDEHLRGHLPSGAEILTAEELEAAMA